MTPLRRPETISLPFIYPETPNHSQTWTPSPSMLSLILLLASADIYPNVLWYTDLKICNDSHLQNMAQYKAVYLDPMISGTPIGFHSAGLVMERLLFTLMLVTSAWAKEKDKVLVSQNCEEQKHPYQVALLDNQRLRCGGVLIDPQWVLTAAHCQKPNLQVLVGKHNIQQWEATAKSSTVAQEIPHPAYDRMGHDNDIMLLRLSQPMLLSSRIRPLELPWQSDCMDNSNTSCLISGWGKTDKEGHYPALLQCATVHLVPHKTCEQAYPNRITPNMVCAGEEKSGSDSCQGDSGGPLVCNERLRGLVSWGEVPCGTTQKPGVYTDICRYRDWIRETVHRF